MRPAASTPVIPGRREAANPEPRAIVAPVALGSGFSLREPRNDGSGNQIEGGA
jgi:hypothetical protein